MPPEIDIDKVCFIIAKTRELDGNALDIDEDREDDTIATTAIDDLPDDADEPTVEELTGFIDNLNDDEQVELVALTWIGRGDFSADEWAEACETASERQASKTSRYLLGIPILGDYLAEGLGAFGLSCDESDSDPFFSSSEGAG